MGTPVPNSAVGPGLGAFLAFFALAVALYFLMRNMNARMRRMAYRERDRIAALEAAEAAKSGTSTPADSASTATPGGAAAQGDAAARKPKRRKPNEP